MLERSSMVRSTRRRIRQSWGVTPTNCLKARTKYQTDRFATCQQLAMRTLGASGSDCSPAANGAKSWVEPLLYCSSTALNTMVLLDRLVARPFATTGSTRSTCFVAP